MCALQGSAGVLLQADRPAILREHAVVGAQSASRVDSVHWLGGLSQNCDKQYWVPKAQPFPAHPAPGGLANELSRGGEESTALLRSNAQSANNKLQCLGTHMYTLVICDGH